MNVPCWLCNQLKLTFLWIEHNHDFQLPLSGKSVYQVFLKSLGMYLPAAGSPCSLSFSLSSTMYFLSFLQDKLLFSFRSPFQNLAHFSCSISELDTPNWNCQDHKTPCSHVFIHLCSLQRCWLPKCNLPSN